MSHHPKDLDPAPTDFRALSRFNGWLAGPAWRRWLFGVAVLAMMGAALALGR